jgi:hypothetical protein
MRKIGKKQGKGKADNWGFQFVGWHANRRLTR